MKYFNLILVLFALNISIGFAQTNDDKNPTLPELYGDFTHKQSEQLKWQKIAKDGKPPYDTHEIIALCAPRCMLFLDDFNDPYNCDIMPGFSAVYQAMQVYQLLGTPGHISILVHGDGHDTVDDVREYAYKWFDRYWITKNK